MKRGLVFPCATVFSAVLAVGAASWAPAARADDSVSQLLARSRAAIGGAALQRVRFLEIESTGHFLGLAGTDRTWQEIGRPKYADFYDAAPLRGGDGYDGKDAWNQDGSGLVWVDGGEAGRGQTIAEAYVVSYALWSPDRGDAAVSFEGAKVLDGRDYQVLRVAPAHSAAPFDVWFDAHTFLPVRFTQTIGPDSGTTTYSDFRSVDGLMVPYASHTQSSDGNSSDTAVVRVTANPADAAAKLVKPPSNVHDFSMTGGASQTSVPFDLVENHVYLSLSLNGKGPYRFILDTGGENVVDPAVAKEIGAEGQGNVQAGGVGANTESASFANVDTMQIGDATVKNQLFAVAPTRLGFGMAGGQPVDGLIGFEVLARFITTFNYGANRVVLAMPSATAMPANANVLPFVFNGRQPRFACVIDGIATQCLLDTGAHNSISLMAPFIAAHPQVVPSATSAVGVNGFGFGGPALGRVGRLRTLSFGAFTIPDVIGDFTAQAKGALAQPFVAANVGGGIWKRFTLTLDYYNRNMALIPNASLNKRDSYERAGVFLLNRGGKYVVFDVRPGTPAQHAGIVRGDAIDSIDGKPASSMSLQAVRETFLQAAGTVLQLGLIGHDGAKRTIALTLQDFV